MIVRRTYLELTDPVQFRPAFSAFPDVTIGRESAATPALYNALYRGVGKDYHWVDRWHWTDAQTAAHLAQHGIHLFVARTGANVTGFYELRQDGAEVEIAYFGLMPDAIGRGLGKHLLSHAVTDAFGLGARRVWLHTCTLDHPAALPNYQARGFRIFKVEEYTQDP